MTPITIRVKNLAEAKRQLEEIHGRITRKIALRVEHTAGTAPMVIDAVAYDVPPEPPQLPGGREAVSAETAGTPTKV